MKPPKPEPVISDAQKAAAEAEIVEQSKRIDFYLTEFSVEILAKKMHDGEYVASRRINGNTRGRTSESLASLNPS